MPLSAENTSQLLSGVQSSSGLFYKLGAAILFVFAGQWGFWQAAGLLGVQKPQKKEKAGWNKNGDKYVFRSGRSIEGDFSTREGQAMMRHARTEENFRRKYGEAAYRKKYLSKSGDK